jgi:DNA-binding NarL/FixJ family response regulator
MGSGTDVPWTAIHEYLLEIETAPTLTEFCSRAVHGIGRVIPWDTAVGLFSQTGDLLYGRGLGEKARDEYHSYYRFCIPFIPQAHYPITSSAALVHDAVCWNDYRGSAYVTDFARPNGMAYALTRLIPDSGLILSLHRARIGGRFKEQECRALYIVNQHVGNLASYYRRADQAQSRLPSPREIVDRFPLLSKREGEVLALQNLGLTASEIATKLFVSIRTVESHIAHVYEKLDVRNRREARVKVSGLPVEHVN